MTKIYMAAAYDVGMIGQGDDLYLLRLEDGRLVGYAPEFDALTLDIRDACTADRYRSAQWFRWPDSLSNPGYRPATFEELRAQGLEKYLLGSKSDMRFKTPLDPL